MTSETRIHVGPEINIVETGVERIENEIICCKLKCSPKESITF